MTKQTPEQIWENISLAAAQEGVTPDTIAKWKERGFVPPSMHYDLAQKALEMGVALSHKDMHDMWKRKRED